MKIPGLKTLHKGQAGFTLVEVLVAVALTGLIGLGAAIGTGQLLNQTSRDTNYTTASRAAANALHWLGRDALMARTIQGWEDFPADPLSFSWTNWDNTACSANYTVVDGVLFRTFSNGVNVSSTRIADHINTTEDMTGCVSFDGTITLTITASAGKGAKIIDVTKTQVITNRPGL
jgi:prepilin-type N-terminal cleavage/methylation domain-containing protein